MRLIEAIKAFWSVLTGQPLVSKTQLNQLQAQLDQAASRAADLRQELDAATAKAKEKAPDRFAEGAVYTLVLLQRQGRLIDFLQEDLAGYDDSQIGAAVRQIHLDCGKALAEHFAVKPVLAKAEGESVEVKAPLDATTVKLTGSVPDAPPYRGTVRHKGWEAANVKLPERTGKVNPTVIQPAEVEI